MRRKGVQGVGQFLAVRHVLERGCPGQFSDFGRQLAPRLMLDLQGVNQSDQLSRLAKSRKEKIFFQFSWYSSTKWRMMSAALPGTVKGTLRRQHSQVFVINEQEPVEQTVLAHQVFGRGDVLSLLVPVLILLLLRSSLLLGDGP